MRAVLDRARSGEHGQGAVADPDSTEVDHGVLG
jgi:hypothetical protein